MGFEARAAIDALNNARGHKQERGNYLEHLREKKWENKEGGDESTDKYEIHTSSAANSGGCGGENNTRGRGGGESSRGRAAFWRGNERYRGEGRMDNRGHASADMFSQPNFGQFSQHNLGHFSQPPSSIQEFGKDFHAGWSQSFQGGFGGHGQQEWGSYHCQRGGNQGNYRERQRYQMGGQGNHMDRSYRIRGQGNQWDRGRYKKGGGVVLGTGEVIKKGDGVVMWKGVGIKKRYRAVIED